MTCGHPSDVFEDSFSKLYQPSRRKSVTDPIIFTQTYNPNQQVNLHRIKNCLENLRHGTLKKAFENKEPLCTTRQPKSLKQLLVKAKFDLKQNEEI